MIYVRQTYLADVIRQAGCTVVEVDDPDTGLPWQTHAAKQPGERTYDPVGLVNHHTASVGNYPDLPWYPVDKLRHSCNLNIKPDGTVYVISAGYQYDSGYGDPDVLAAIRNDEPLPAPDDTDTQRVLMNPWFIDIECDHPGDGRPITDEQYEALVKTNAAILTHQGWATSRLVGHLELTRRKIDPYWNNDRHAMDKIRADTLRLMEDDMADVSDPRFQESWDKAHLVGMYNEYTQPQDVTTAEKLAVFLDRIGLLDSPTANLAIETEMVEVVKSVAILGNL